MENPIARCIFIPQSLWAFLSHTRLHTAFLSLVTGSRGPMPLNLPLCPLLQTSAVSNLAPWPPSPLRIYLNISPIACAPLSFPSIPRSFHLLMQPSSLSAALLFHFFLWCIQYVLLRCSPSLLLHFLTSDIINHLNEMMFCCVLHLCRANPNSLKSGQCTWWERALLGNT